LEAGLEVARFHACGPLPAAAPSITVVRANPERFHLQLAGAPAGAKEAAKTAAAWAVDRDLVLATNAGMYAFDYAVVGGQAAPRYRHAGYVKEQGRVANARRASYKSVLAFDPRRKGLPPVFLADLEQEKWDWLEANYDSLVQNLRMIGHRRRNVWSRSDRRWSTSALGLDKEGRLLFLFARDPSSVHDLNECLLKLPLGLERAQYLEGGVEASLAVRTKKETFECGGVREGEASSGAPQPARPIPFVLGLKRR
jgi:uncharacterized protein YigE (DUF2233 family)